MNSDNCFVFAIKDKKIIFFKSFHYPEEKEVAQEAYTYAQKAGEGFYMTNLSRWQLTATGDETFGFNIPQP